MSLRAVGAVTLVVEDPRRAQAFYESAFDVTPIYQDSDAATFKLDNLLLNVLRREAALELVEPAPVAPPASGSSFQLTIWVEDADAACSELERRGVTLLNGPVDRDWGVRTAAFADPDGHVWELAQQLESS